MRLCIRKYHVEGITSYENVVIKEKTLQVVEKQKKQRNMSNYHFKIELL